MATIKSFRDASFLREKYLHEGLSLAEIGSQTLSTPKTIRKYLMRHGIDLRPRDQVQRLRQERFGMKLVNGELRANHAESRTLAQMRFLRKEGRSIRDIVSILNGLGIPCRKPGAKWHVKTVYQCLKMNQ